MTMVDDNCLNMKYRKKETDNGRRTYIREI